jgi:aspartyl-tRNA(Asn)/glutamyl-tRNA(Gln) amidotransferase subunit C
MTITEDTVRHVARLARMELTGDDLRRYTQELSKILGFVEQLSQLDLSKVALDLTREHETLLREDVALRAYDRETLMRNAPNEEEGFFRVPKILDDEADN